MKLDLSIGQRLAVGFALMLAILAALLFGVSQAHEASARAQTAYARHIVPLAESARSVEQSLYRVAIALRNFLLEGDEPAFAAYRAALEDVRNAVRALGELRKYDIGESLYRDAASLVAMYLLEAEEAAEARRRGPLRPRAERELARARDRAVASILAFSDYHAGASRAARASAAAARESVTLYLQLGSLVAAAWFLLVAYFTARAVSRPARELARVAHGFETGLWKPALPWAPRAGDAAEPRDEMARLRRALGAAAAALEKREARLYADGQVAAAAASSLDAGEIGEFALIAIAEQVQAEGAVLFVREASEELRPIATYALEMEVQPVRIGVGVAGEAAKLGRPVVVHDVPRDTPFRVNLGIGQTAPRTIAAVPLVFRHEVAGVLLVASLRDIDEADMPFLRAAAAQLAIGLRNAATHEQVQRLLEKVREQNAEIQAQNEEIQAQNEEIQAQNEEIQAQNEELQAHGQKIQAQNEELHAHTRELVQADEHKNRFLGVLAHELCNPLAAASNAVSVLRQEAGEREGARRALDLLERQVRHLEVLVNDLNDIARMSEGKLRVERGKVDFARVVRECVADQEPVMRSRGLELVSRLGPPVWVCGDTTRLAQIVNNLLANAAKFSDPGQRITVTVECGASRPEAVLEVRDEGVGVDPAFLTQLFQPFSQSLDTRARTRGRGLGLALVKALAELHGGRVEAYSEGAGKGARFRVALPLYRRDARTTADPVDLRIAVERREA